jgi:hypothetical protein
MAVEWFGAERYGAERKGQERVKRRTGKEPRWE